MPAKITPENALFLDVDGTLIDLAATPDAVIVPPELHGLLRELAKYLGGALAILTGRPIAAIGHLVGPGLNLAGEHGAVLCHPDGTLTQLAARPESLDAIAGELRETIAGMAGVLLEEKKFGLALHWRGAPHQAAALTALVQKLAAPHHSLTLQPAHQALEIRAAGPDKGKALEFFMRAPPFAGKKPVFVGDDVTDEPAIAAAARLGGTGLHVATDFAGSPTAVRAWLTSAIR